MGPGTQWPLWGPAQEEVSEWGSIRNESSLSHDVKASAWVGAALSHHQSQLAPWMLTWTRGFIAFTRFSKEPVIHRGQESLDPVKPEALDCPLCTRQPPDIGPGSCSWNWGCSGALRVRAPP